VVFNEKLKAFGRTNPIGRARLPRVGHCPMDEVKAGIPLPIWCVIGSWVAGIRINQ